MNHVISINQAKLQIHVYLVMLITDISHCLLLTCSIYRSSWSSEWVAEHSTCLDLLECVSVPSSWQLPSHYWSAQNTYQEKHGKIHGKYIYIF